MVDSFLGISSQRTTRALSAQPAAHEPQRAATSHPSRHRAGQTQAALSRHPPPPGRRGNPFSGTCSAPARSTTTIGTSIGRRPGGSGAGHARSFRFPSRGPHERSHSASSPHRRAPTARATAAGTTCSCSPPRPAAGASSTPPTTVVHVETLTGFDDLLSQASALAVDYATEQQAYHDGERLEDPLPRLRPDPPPEEEPACAA